MSKTFDDLLWKVNSCDKKKLAVAVAQDKAVLEAVKAAKERGIADAVLVGDEAKIKEVFGEVEILANVVEGETGFITSEMSEAQYHEKAAQAGNVLGMIRMD